MGAKRIRRDLRAAMDLGRPVLARRRLWKADHLEGFVVGVDRSWALLHLVRDVDLIGWSAVRLDTIRDVEHQDHGFLGRALALTGARPGMLDVDLSDLPPLLRSAARRFPILTLYTEARDPSVCAIGRPQRIGARSVTFLDISSEAEWADDTRGIRLDDVTRVDLGGRYEDVLHRLAGYPPIPG